MNTHRFKSMLFGITTIAGLLAGTSLSAAEQQDTDGDFARGARAWAENCSRCHNTRYPQEFRDDLWKPIVYHMRVRGGLTGQETRDILKYLTEAN